MSASQELSFYIQNELNSPKILQLECCKRKKVEGIDSFSLLKVGIKSNESEA